MELVDDRDDEPHDRLHHLVFLDGVLIDCYATPVEGSGYECAALELAAQRRRSAPEPRPPAWEAELQALDRAVGGRAVLMGLTDDPLEARGVPAICAEPSAQLDALDLGTEFTTAVRNTLVHLAECCPRLVDGSPEQVAAALSWVVARANDMTGAGGRLRQVDLCRAFRVKQFPSTLASQMTTELQRFLPEASGPFWGRPARHELGLPDALVVSVRHRIVQERDRALAARERARRDEEARGA